MNDHLKAHRDFQQVMDDSMSKLRETFQTWLQQRQEQVVNLDTYTPEPSQCQKIPICYDDDDDEDYTIAITLDLPITDSLIMEDEHLDTISATESDESRNRSCEKESSCFCPNDDDDDDEEYTIAITPVLPTVEPDNSLSMGDEHLSTIPEKEESSVEDLVPIPSESEALKDNPTPSSDFVTKSPSISSNFFLEETNTFDNYLPQFETFNFLDDHTKETSSGSTTTHADISLPEYDSFHLDSEPDSGDFTMDVVEDIFNNPTREPRVHVPNVLPTYPTLHLDSDLTLSSDSLGSDLVVSFQSRTRNKIFDPGIFIGVQSKRFLSPDKFSISFIRDPPFPVIDTLLPFSSENEDKVVNPGILAAGEEKSHQGFKAFQLISESPMMISGGDIPILDVPFLHFYPP
ncbi:hypothetical protein Tco_1430412 [Tanacetum coccineum]